MSLITIINDVDKFHCVGAKKDNKQDIIVRFKSHTAKEDLYRKKKNVRRGIKIRPSLAPGRKALLDQANQVLDDYYSDRTNLKNPPHFVFADMHGNLKLKMTNKTRNRLFFKFYSITDLCSLIERNQGDVDDNNIDIDIYGSDSEL